MLMVLKSREDEEEDEDADGDGAKDEKHDEMMKLMVPPGHKSQEEEVVVHVDVGLQQLMQLLHCSGT